MRKLYLTTGALVLMCAPAAAQNTCNGQPCGPDLSIYETITAHNSSIVNFVTAAQVGTQITSALSSYETVSAHNSSIANFVTASQVTTQINTALSSYVTATTLASTIANYSTTTQMNTAIANAVPLEFRVTTASGGTWSVSFGKTINNANVHADQIDNNANAGNCKVKTVTTTGATGICFTGSILTVLTVQVSLLSVAASGVPVMVSVSQQGAVSQ